MARARNIKPAFFKNEVLAEVSAETRLLFIGLWTLSDREGRLEDRPKRIRAEIFPLEMLDVEPMLARLTDDGFLVRYEVDSVKYIQIENFVKHQDPHYKEKASDIPPPPGRSDIIKATSITRTLRARILERDDYTCQGCGAKDHLCIDHVIPASRGGSSDDDNLQVLCMSCNTKKGNKLSGEQKGLKKSKHAPSAVITRPNVDPALIQQNDPSPSDSLIPDSLSLDSLFTDSLTTDPSKDQKPLVTGVTDFESFWKLYPRKVSKSDALKTWNKINPDQQLMAKIYEGLTKYLASEDWAREAGKYIKHPATWLNHGCWNDDPKPASNVIKLNRHSGFDQADYNDGLDAREDGTHGF